MQPYPIRRLLIFGVVSLLTISPGRAQSPNVEEDTAEALRLNTDAARRYRFELVGDPSRELEWNPTSLLRWSNPVAGQVFGNVFVWTHNGRPEVIGSIYQWYVPHTHGSHEFQSLSSSPLTGYRDGMPVWTSSTPGVEMKPLPYDAGVASASPTRLRQARGIANAFQIKKTDRKKVSREMRLLAQPLLRYGSEASGIVDGALFVFVQGTDPEVFLMVEAKRSGGTLRWEYGLARMNSVDFVARYHGQEIWRVKAMPWTDVKSGQGPYTSFGPFERK